MSSNLQNSIWPNEGGTLGQIKVQIPTGTTNDPWPTGDALVNNFVYHKGKLVGFVDTKALIANSSKSTIFPYEYVNISLPSIAEGEMTYNHDQCAYFILNGKVLKGDIPSDEELEIITKKYTGCKTVPDVIAVDPDYLINDIVDGVWSEGLGDLKDSSNGSCVETMFYNCANLTTFTSDLHSLTNGQAMFAFCTNLTTFSADLSSLVYGKEMFQYCYNLTTFTSDLSSLTDGIGMFAYTKLANYNGGNLSLVTTGNSMFFQTKITTFSSDLSSLTDGSYMFRGCTNLESFSSDLPNLWNGYYMFRGCTNLESFSSDLSSLLNGEFMFDDCKLDTASVQNIADTIATASNGILHIGIGNDEPNEQEIAAFNNIASKNWTVYVNGSEYTSSGGSSCCCAPSCASCCATCCASLTTLDETDGEFVAPKPYWAKPVPSDEQHARYVDAEGNFYNILGAQFIYGDNLETYGMFTSLEDAAANMRLKKIGEEEIETA